MKEIELALDKIQDAELERLWQIAVAKDAARRAALLPARSPWFQLPPIPTAPVFRSSKP